MSQLRCVFLFLLCFFITIIKSEVTLPDNEEYSKEISAVLNHLNSNPIKIYTYKNAKFVNATKKADTIIGLNLDINVECIRKGPELPCTDTTLSCFSYVRTENETIEILRKVFCNSIDVPTAETFDQSTVENVASETQDRDIGLSNEAVSTMQEGDGDHFIAVKSDSVPCLGCPFNLNPDAEGVGKLVDLALKHIESERNNKHTLLKVVKLQQQIVSGVKYILLAEFAPTKCEKSSLDNCPIDTKADTFVCEVVYYQKPWISQDKHIIKNNCTVSQEFVEFTGKTNELSNDITGGAKKSTNIHDKNFDRIAENGVAEELNSGKLEDLESQILLGIEPNAEIKPKNDPKPQLTIIDEFILPEIKQKPVESAPSPSSPPGITEIEPTEDNPTDILATELGTIQERAELTISTTEMSDLAKSLVADDNQTKRGEENSSEEEQSKATTEKLENNQNKSPESTKQGEKNISDEEKSKATTKKDNNLSKSSESSESDSSEEKAPIKLRRKRAVRQFEKISPEEKSTVKNLADFAAATLNGIDDDNYKRIVLQILGAKKLASAEGAYFHLILRMGISKCQEDKPLEQNCRDKLLENYTKICKVQIYVSDDFATPKIEKSQCQNIKRDNDSNRTNYSRFRRQLVGGQQKYDENSTKIQELLDEGIQHLNSETGAQTPRLKVVETLNATSQVVAGVLYRIRVKMVTVNCAKTAENCEIVEGATPKACTIQVWEKVWMKWREYTIKCEGEPDVKFVKTTSRRKRAISSRNAEEQLLFNDFLATHNVKYSNKAEYRYRLKVFSDNLSKIKSLNLFEEGTAHYGVTKFADLTEKEFSKRHGLKPELRQVNEAPMARAEIPDIELPESFDWRTKKAVAEVKDQGQCGSCWAFSVTGNIEGQYAIKHGELVEFSEQELVDCDKVDQGCNGGLMDNAYRVIEKLGGLEEEQDYPYESEDEKCTFNKTLIKAELSGAVNISQDETEMAKWLVQNGPISIAINANAMQFYVGGVSHPLKFLCNPKSLDHGVLIVGYGVHTYPLFKKSLPFWIVKNSWGPGWGEQGYYRVYRGDGTCGVNQTPSSAIVV